MRLPNKSVARYLDQDRSEHSHEVVNMKGQAMPVYEAGRPERKLIQRICESGRKVSFEKGSVLFEQGQKARGIYLILEGAARLSMGSPEGRVLILEFVGAGSIVGLAENIRGIPYEKTAASTEVTNAFFLRRNAFLALLQEDARLAFEAAELLSERFLKVLGELKTIGLSESALQKLAVFVLGLSFTQKEDRTYIRLPGASQEDLARMIGISRETASRMLSRLKEGNILYWTHSAIVIQDLPALEKIASAGRGKLPAEGRKAAVGGR